MCYLLEEHLWPLPSKVVVNNSEEFLKISLYIFFFKNTANFFSFVRSNQTEHLQGGKGVIDV